MKYVKEETKEESLLEVARKLLKDGISVDIIEKATSLPRERIIELAKSN